MGSMSNGGLCERSSIKRPLENGNCTSSGVPHKYKKRKVSAVRDFPPGCGRNAPRINQKPQETESVASLGDKENLVADEKNVNDEIGDCSKPVQNGNGSIESLVELELTNSLDDLVAKVVAEAGKDMVKSSLIVDPLGSDLPKALEINAPESSNELLDKEVQAVVKTVLEIGSKADGMAPASGAKALSPIQWPVSNINILKDTSLKNKIPRRRVSAIRDFPPFCGRNAPCPTEEECLKLGLGNKTLCAPDKAVEHGGMLSETVREQGGMLSETVRAKEEDIPVRETGRTEIEELDGDVQDGKFQKRQLEGNVETGRTVVEELDGDVQNGKSQKRLLEGNVPVSKTKSQKRELEGNVLVPKTKSRKTSMQGKPLAEKVRADAEGGIVRETTGDGVEELNKDVRDRKSQKRQLEGKVETGRTGVEELDGDVQDGKSQKRQLEGNVLVPKTKSQKRELEGNVLVPAKSRKTSMQGKPLVVKVRADVERSPARETTGDGVEELNKDVRDGYAQKLLLEGSVPERKTKSQKVIAKDSEDVNGVTGEVGKEIVIYSHDKSLMSNSPGDDSVALGHDVERVIVLGLMAAPNCPWRQGRGFINTGLVSALTKREVREEELQVVNYVPRGEKSEFVSRANVNEGDHVRGKSMKKKLFPSPSGKAASKGKGLRVVKDEEDFPVKEQDGDSSAFERPHDFEVMLPPFGPNSSSQGDARNKVRVTLRLFQAIYRKLLQGEEAKFRRKGDPSKRIDMQAAQIVRSKGREVNVGKHIIGSVPGVEVGDEFQYRVELALVGIHRPYQAGIDYMKNGGMIICTSIVASGGYADDLDNPDVLIYSGQGGNIVGPNKQPEDQKLERGNLALKNCISTKNPVRVIRGFKETKASNSDVRGKVVATYTYDGLYTVEKYWQDVGQHGKLVFKFELWRVPGQQELAWKEAKKSNKFKIREGRCVDDISGGKELFPICAVNTVDDEIPPAFKYITEMKYPDWYCPTFPRGCDCIGGCSDAHKCSCVIMNGGEIPYNYNGAIVEVKPLVYECSPYCKCPPSCYNRVTQHGIKIQLEIFKTESRGWGVRSLTSIPSGSFICEYIGELLEDKEAEQRHNDEYLFDIGQNYTDCMDGLKPDEQSSLSEVVEDSGFTIDAAQYGNVGRFINHSCSPNLYAQNVLYDHEDKKMPHIMFFAAENIPPLQELTYHYNYSVDQICDSNGNIKKKNCYCGSADCTGRMY